MNPINQNLLRAFPCADLVPFYQKTLVEIYIRVAKMPNPNLVENERYKSFETIRTLMLYKIQTDIEFPLNSLRKKVARLVEELFKKKGERTIIFGCMHYPSTAVEEFIQTQTDIEDLLPQKISRTGEDHHHQTAVTVDRRYSPDEHFELLLENEERLLNTTRSAEKISPLSPDFARRDFKKIFHLEDFTFVERIDKIYVERLPYLENGPCNVENPNIHLFTMLHKLLGLNGILAFDYFPYVDVLNNKGRLLLRNTDNLNIEVSEEEIEEFMKNSPYREIFNIKGPVPGISCNEHQGTCPVNPCPSVQSNIARSALTVMAVQENKKKSLIKAREELSGKPKAVLTTEEIGFRIKNRFFPFEDFQNLNPEELPLQEFPDHSLAIKYHPKRTIEEMRSLEAQIDSYRVLNVSPSLEGEIDPKIKEGLDKALVLLVEKMVFPALKLLGFERVSFDPNRQNPENKRLFERVVYVKKIDV